MIAQVPVMPIVGMTMEDFIVAYDAAPFELSNGEIVTLKPNLPVQGLLMGALYKSLRDLPVAAPHTVWMNMPFLILDDRSCVMCARTPKLIVFDQTRIATYKATTPDWLDKPFIIVPDLCVEIVSKNDDFADVMAKVEGYLADGVRLVWVFEPYTRTVTVRAAGSAQALILHDADTLDGGAVITGFSVRVGDAFDAE
jgi:Uma2 family endonuclease